MDETFKVNREKWDELATVNTGPGSDYGIDAFLAGDAGGRDLHRTELEELGSVDGLDLLHLQCHFGLDSLILARKGARVTGLDFSPVAIAKARELAATANLDARFVEGNVYDAPKLIEGTFDLVYVSWGTICWLPDIAGWARVVAHFVKPGGRFYFLDMHPILATYDEPAERLDTPRFDYFHKPAPLAFDNTDAYADADAVLKTTRSYEWIHPVGEVATALIEAGLTLEYLHEHDTVAWKAFPFLVPAGGGLWRFPDGMARVPASFSISARKSL